MTYLRLFVEKIIVYRDRVEVIYKFESNTTKKDIKKTTDYQKDEKSIVSAVSVMVQPTGFEPVASTFAGSRSSNWAMAA